MSKVQSPKSEAQIPAADFGLWTLDLGLNVNGVCKAFKSPDGNLIEVLRGVSFAVEPGEAVAITGASGAGKSTLLHLLGGLEAADEGRIALGDVDITEQAPAALAQFRNEAIGFVFQFHHLLPDLSAAENVAMPLLISRVSKHQSLAPALQILETLGLRDRADHPVRHLSGGEQQRVAVARALVKQPRLVLADEPTGNLDNATGDEIAEILLAYCRSRRAMVVIATHNERLAARCDRPLALANGRLTPATKDQGRI
jgi:lipoprotein-releasing system ATP-binding protein